MILASLDSLVHTVVVGALAYAALVGLLRVSGKRTLAKWSAFDLVVTVAFGSVLASAILTPETSVVQVVLAFTVLVALQFTVTWLSVRVPALERAVKASPALLVYRGALQQDTLRAERVTEREVLAALRSHGVVEFAEVGALVLETDGNFSLIRQSAMSGARLDSLDPLARPDSAG